MIAKRSWPVFVVHRLHKLSVETVIDVGPGISPPKPTFTPDPDYPLSVLVGTHKIQGTCVLG
jgi:hypothetical protein